MIQQLHEWLLLQAQHSRQWPHGQRLTHEVHALPRRQGQLLTPQGGVSRLRQDQDSMQSTEGQDWKHEVTGWPALPVELTQQDCDGSLQRVANMSGI